MRRFYIPSSSFTEFPFFIKRMCHFISCKSLHSWCHYKLMCRGKREVMVGHSKLQMKFMFCFCRLTLPGNTVHHETLFSLMFFLNFHLILTAWRIWVIGDIEAIQCFFFFFLFRNAQRRNILCLDPLYTDFTSDCKHTIPKNVIILNMTSRNYKYFSFKIVMGGILIFFSQICILSNTFPKAVHTTYTQRQKCHTVCLSLLLRLQSYYFEKNLHLEMLSREFKILEHSDHFQTTTPGNSFALKGRDIKRVPRG